MTRQNRVKYHGSIKTTFRANEKGPRSHVYRERGPNISCAKGDFNPYALTGTSTSS